ncbi:MAG: triose-phosphate isomerase [Candidatus Aenigmarchaeota archaeon]|nr:triose-phosphate isomerase [Candidatus Aenigmarchaeota archaeon]
MMLMKKPIIVLNFKNNKSSVGKNALKLSQIAESISKKIIVCVQAADIYPISKSTGLKVFAQHIDPIDFGSDTGFILPESVRSAGAKGTLINHSEHRLDLSTIKATLRRAKDLHMTTIICAKDAKESAMLSKLNPDYIAMEPPELIGGDISVSTAKPQVIKNTVDLVKKANPKVLILVGAGVKTGEDVKKSLELGADGILIASGVTKAKYPVKVLKDLCSI